MAAGKTKPIRLAIARKVKPWKRRWHSMMSGSVARCGRSSTRLKNIPASSTCLGLGLGLGLSLGLGLGLGVGVRVRIRA